MNTINIDRAAFEAWATSLPLEDAFDYPVDITRADRFAPDDKLTYCERATRKLYVAWQAAMQSQNRIADAGETMATVKDSLTDQAAAVPVEWEGGEGWESLAWELCADENGEVACNELIWEGGPTPEPWGDRWLKYEDEAKRLIALVHKHTTPPATQAALGALKDGFDLLGEMPRNKEIQLVMEAFDAAIAELEAMGVKCA